MPDIGARELVHRLRGHTLRVHTGILLLTPQYLGKEPDLAVTLNVESVNYAQVLLDGLPVNTNFVGISAETEEARLDAVASSPEGMNCVLIYNLDLALAKLDMVERGRFWNNMRDNFPHRRRALLLAIPQQANALLPNVEDWKRWREGSRIALASEM